MAKQAKSVRQRNRIWSAAEEQLLIRLWEKAGHRRDQFRMLCQEDPKLSRRGPNHGWSSCRMKARDLGLIKQAKPSAQHRYIQLSEEERKRFREMAVDDTVTYDEMIKAFPKFKTAHQIYRVAHDQLGLTINKGEIERKRKAETERQQEIAQTKAELTGLERQWSQPDELEANAEAWASVQERVGYCSRIDWRGQGYRTGTVRLFFQESARRGCHFNVLNAGIINKEHFKGKLPRYYQDYARKTSLRNLVRRHLITEAVNELASAIPRIRKPKKVWRDPNVPEYVKLYITTSPFYDGPRTVQSVKDDEPDDKSFTYGSTFGETVAQRLGMVRDDIIVYKEGSDRLVASKDRVIMTVNQPKSRLPNEHHSTGPERIIKDKLGSSDRAVPDLIVVGGQAVSIFKPSGEKFRAPYLTIPALSRLEGNNIGENQEGMAISEVRDGVQYVQFVDFKTIIHNERLSITGIKQGANELHQRIVDCIKSEGHEHNVTLGTLHDRIGGDRNKLQKALEFLQAPSPVDRATWPGLHYHESSRTWDFHLDWFQERFRHVLPASYINTRLLAFGCLHAGYCTTDYPHFRWEYPKIIMANKVHYLFGLGDFVAGLAHAMMHRGDIMGSMDYNDQENFAAELVASVMLDVFRQRLQAAIANRKQLTPQEVEQLCLEALVIFVYIAGNHDTWQHYSGNTPLEIFHGKVLRILEHHIPLILNDLRLPTVDAKTLAMSHVVRIGDFDPTYTLLESGLRVGMIHPSMARAETTSLRAEQVLRALPDVHVALFANFHVATTIHMWQEELGQRVSVEVPTQVVHTAFEKAKLKRLDFGPVYLGIRSHEQRIYETEIAYFNTKILTHPYHKSHGLEDLKRELQLFRAV